MTAVTWESYIGGNKSSRRDTALFPTLDTPDFTKHDLLVDRFRWLCTTFGDSSEELFTRWQKAGDYLTNERLEHRDLTLAEFHLRSTNLVLVMARVEVDNCSYYRSLRDSLKLRSCRNSHPVLVLGPTFGGEVESVEAAGSYPHLVGDASPWRTVCEERLFHDRVRFENLSQSEFVQNPVNSKYMVISPWVPDAVGAVREAYNALGEFGFVLFPAANVAMTDVSETVGLRRQDDFQDSVAVYFKHPGLQEVLGVEDVHLEK